ncbi:hypothetical protein PR048_010358 [Dryococelus australis]|uniref:Uncharacterized protein n=1 Tax=Dryococelus australis TaxID=614101 RepID=A0ABQ9I2H3_9NEOP|nr:hypothetical protein PR048_010358 [Dryococelus australis]
MLSLKIMNFGIRLPLARQHFISSCAFIIGSTASSKMVARRVNFFPAKLPRLIHEARARPLLFYKYQMWRVNAPVVLIASARGALQQSRLVVYAVHAVRLLASHQGKPGSIPGWITPDFREWESGRTLPLVGGFSRYLPFPPFLHSEKFVPNSKLHNYETRQNSNLHIPTLFLSLCQKGIYYAAVKIFNSLPSEYKRLWRLVSEGLEGYVKVGREGMRCELYRRMILGSIPALQGLLQCKGINAVNGLPSVLHSLVTQAIAKVPAGNLRLFPVWFVLNYPPRRSGFNPRPGHSGFSHVGIVPDDAVGRPVFSGISRLPRLFIPVLLHTSITLIGSQDPDVESRPNLFTHSL